MVSYKDLILEDLLFLPIPLELIEYIYDEYIFNYMIHPW
jgi:hypothetical protein